MKIQDLRIGQTVYYENLKFTIVELHGDVEIAYIRPDDSCIKLPVNVKELSDLPEKVRVCAYTTIVVGRITPKIGDYVYFREEDAHADCLGENMVVAKLIWEE